MKQKIIEIKTPEEIAIIRECAGIVSEILANLKNCLTDGVTTYDLEAEAKKHLVVHGVTSAFKGYRGYPSVLCVSVNDELVHGIPRKTKKIKSGDIVSLDIGIKYKGFYGDVAATYPVGRVGETARRMLKIGSEIFEIILKNCVSGKRLGDLSASIQKYIESHNFSVVRDYVGHGIGRHLHEEPSIPNYGVPGIGVRLQSGMVLAVEPMFCEGGYDMTVDADNWTVKTTDGKLCAHFEHMILVGDNPEILTYW